MTDSQNRAPKDFLQLAADAAAQLQHDCDGLPEMEFLTWLRIALKREAMVSIAYDRSFVADQLRKWQRDRGIHGDVVSAVQTAISNVWVQEETHQRYFALILESVYEQQSLRAWIRKELEHI